MAKILVDTPARLHLGLLDTNGDLGRLYGSIGAAIQYPNVSLEAELADRLIVEGLEKDRLESIARRFLQANPSLPGARLALKASIPNHVGLGSGTQLALAVGSALSLLGQLELDIQQIALATGRGVHSGIGIAAFEAGGFILDGGHRVGKDRTLHQGKAVKNVPPVLFQHALPEEWFFVVAVPRAEAGFSGERESQAFHTLPKAHPSSVEKISRQILMKMLPAVVEGDIRSFGEALTSIQQLVGDCFKAVQGGRFANRVSDQLICHLLEKGVLGAGQSSWGPTVYALTEGLHNAQQLQGIARDFLSHRTGGEVFCIHADNHGAKIREAS